MIIASRTLTLHAHSGTANVRIDIFQPQEDNNGWICRYVIGWPDNPWTSGAGGQDAIQALLCAMQKIGMELYFSAAHKTGQLTWSKWDGFGFPVPQDARDLLIGDDAKYL